MNTKKEISMNGLIIYGAGGKGLTYLRMLKKCSLDDRVVSFCDERAESIKELCSLPVVGYEIARLEKISFLIAVKRNLKIRL